ncbi:WXG100 family type VII secretion target [Mycobacterium kyorinense]|uniref:ESAT-6-like protein n=1 Tax=Mycobacterium kyorinense TaxID=487514 RepID=A0A1X1Y0K6_9MYCO|nr:WXG100 family type VII secretion target [Mycobacterium kyorinense]ORW04561.1 hypothetical protein AWC14_02990 [Mycobacterium kyorinense]
MNRYRIELEELSAFVDRLEAFEQRAESIAADVDQQIAQLHEGWFGSAAEQHQARHNEWMAAAEEMREAVAELRAAAKTAHRNYTEVIAINTAMWP